MEFNISAVLLHVVAAAAVYFVVDVVVVVAAAAAAALPPFCQLYKSFNISLNLLSRGKFIIRRRIRRTIFIILQLYL